MDKTINEISTSIYNSIIGEYNDIKGAEAKRDLANTIESKVRTWLNTEVFTAGTAYSSREAWKPIRNVALTTGRVGGESHSSANNGNTQQFVWTFPVSELNLSSTVNTDADIWVRVRLNLEKQAVSAKVLTLSDLTLTVPWNGDKATITGSVDRYIKVTSAPISLKDATGKIVAELTVTDGSKNAAVLTITKKNGYTPGNKYELTTPLDLNDHNKDHKIKYIQGGGSCTLTSESWSGPNNSYNDTSWKVGDNTSQQEVTTDTPATQN